MWFVWLLLLSVAHQGLGAYTFIDVNNPVVQTQFGPVRGARYQLASPLNSKLASQNIVAFIGIPYAAPPTGANRFGDPRSPITWIQEMDCTNRRVLCPQGAQRFQLSQGGLIREDEDCLHLNVYVPVDRAGISLPVVVYFHGGEFKYGGKDLYKPDYLLSAGANAGHNMIVVTVNYRLGVLGFLSTDDINQPGNNGIRDQVLALEWVNQNIAKFNGNPQSVTIMGHDAGAVSVSMHILNPQTKDYFQSAISISGTVFSPWAIEDNPVQQAREFGYHFSCDWRTDRLVDCLRYQDLGSLIAAQNERDWENNLQRFWFKPVVDRNSTTSAILRDFPLQLYNQGSFNRKPYMLAGTTYEGSLEFYLQAPRLKQFPDLAHKIGFLIRPFLKDYVNEEILASAFEYQYFNRTVQNVILGPLSSGGGPNSLLDSPFSLSSQYNSLAQSGYNAHGSGTFSNLNGFNQYELDRVFCDMLGDFLYLGPMDFAAQLHSKQADTIVTLFSYLGTTKSFGALQKDVQQQVSRDTYGVTHMNDIFYLLPNDYDASNLQGLDIAAASNYARYMAEFILFGTAQTRYVRYTVSSPNYQLVTTSGQIQPVSVGRDNGYRTRFMDFINRFIYKLQDIATNFPPYFPVEEYKAYQQATWSLVALVIIVIIIAIVIIVVLVLRNRKNDDDEGTGEVTLKTRSDEQSPLRGP